MSFFLLFTILLQSQTIKYVTVNGAGSKDGSSWTNASDNLQKMISLSSGGTQIWIAKGTYTPKVALAPNNNAQDRNNTFGLKKDVKLYGGFSGSETSISQRNITANETILSGNLGGGKYAHHVVLIHALEANENYYLDGLTISEGKCDLIEFYTISDVTKGLSANDKIKDSYPDWFVSMTESPYYSYTSMGLQLLGKGALPGVLSIPGGNVRTVEILNTSYPKSNGGGILNFKGVLTLDNVTFKNNSGDYGAAISLQDEAHATLTNCNFINNRSDDHGGAITTSKSYLTITGGSFNNNTSNMGAAIADLGGKLLNITNVSFDNNNTVKVKQPYRYGGAIYIEHVTQDLAQIRTINNCTFTNNSADYGGAIYADDKIRNLKVTNSTFTGNSSLMDSRDTAFGGGGAIMLRKVIDADIQGNTFTNNNALKGLGGALLLMETNGVKLLNNTFSGSTSWLGGALCLLENKNIVTISGNTFTENRVTQSSDFSVSGIGGALVSLKDNNVQTSNNTFTRNTAAKQGGAIYFETYTVNSVINTNNFNSNSSNKFGGALYAASLTDNKLKISNNTFDNNSSVERGGALFLSNTIAANVHNNLFTKNSSTMGAAVDFESSGTTHFFSNTVRGNTGVSTERQTGSVISVLDGTNKLYNNVFTKNENYTAILYTDSTVEFVNNTVWNEVSAYGIYLAGKSAKVYNNILEELVGSSTTADVRNNSFRNDYENKFVTKNNNIREANVYFADVTNNNFNLTGCSPIINRGTNSLYASDYTNTDFSGQNRKVSTIDIGAYENELGVSGKTIPTVASTQAFCSEAIVNDLKATGVNVKWYNQALGGNPLASNTSLISGTTYYASQTVNGCESDRESVVVSINSTEAPTAVSPQNFIIGQPGAKIVVNGSNLKWYTQEAGGTALPAVPSLNMSTVNSATYWVSQTNANNCESVRTKIVVNVTKIPLVIKAVNKVKVFDGSVYGNNNYTVTYSGFEAGDTESNSISGSISFTGDATTATEPGIYTIIPQGITSGKYTVLYEEATLEIKSNLLLTDNILYVKQNGSGDGASWSNALNNLELALTRAAKINSVHTDNNDPKKVKRIFVAKGTYQLASGKSYVMPKAVEIYGGFDPDNAIINLTHQRITGDLNGGSILRGNNAPVIKNDDNGLDNTTLLNGFTITNGSANNGAGIYNKKVSAKFENCIIKANTASANGGGVYNENANTTWVNCLIVSNTAPNGASMYNNASLPTLLNTTIADNTGAQGATLYNANGSSPRIVNTVSVKNSSDIVNNASYATYENSLIQGVNGITGSTTVIDASYALVSGNTAVNAGNNNPANITLPVKDLTGKSRIIDSTVDIGAFEKIRPQTITANAITKTYGDAPFTHGTASSGLPLQFTASSDNNVAKIEDGKIKIVNVGTAIITVSQSGNGNEYDAATATFTLTIGKKMLTVTADNKSKVQDNAVFTGFSVSYTGFVSGDTPQNSLIGNLVFSGAATTATAIGANYQIIPSGYTSTKYEIVYTQGSLTINPDITLVDGTLYVKKGATGNGTSWNNALGELSDALDIVRIINVGQTIATKIFVSVGSYSPKSGQSFTMFKGVNMYGGFDPDNGITTLLHKRKFSQSILNKGVRESRVITNNDNGLTNADIIDGFTIGGSGVDKSFQGGGIYNYKSSPTIVNCIIRDNVLFPFPANTSITKGGGIYNDNSNPILINCIIKNNRVGVDGSVIYDSRYYGYGSAMYNANNSNPKLYNCTIRDNSSISGNKSNAPAIVNDANCTTTLYNSIYMNNNIGVSSGITSYNSIVQKDDNIAEGIYNNTQTVATSSDIFEGNSTTLKEDSFAKDKGSNTHYTFNNLSMYDINGYNRLTGTIDVGAEELRTPQNIIAADLTKTYGDDDFTHPSLIVNSNLQLTHTKSSNVTVATIVDGKIHILNTGTTTITITQVGNENYAPTEKTFVLTIGKATLTVKANDKSKTANNLAFPVANYEVSYTGFVNGDDKSKLTGSLSYSGTGTSATQVGIYTNGIMPAGLSSNNYNFTYEPGTLKILPNTTLTNKTLYVKQGTIGGDGSSWELALNDLSLALKHASILNNNTAGTVDKIYVAKGTYTPKYSSRDNSNFIDEGRDNSFLLFDGIKLYGGFNGTIANETLADRRIAENKTILDGQSTIYHIVTVVNATGNYEIDGFTISNGAAGYGSDGSVVINGKTIRREHGAAIRAAKANITIKNCIMTGNSSGHAAGALYLTEDSTVLIYNTLFYGNSAYHHGALGSSMVVSNSNVKIVNTTFGDRDGDSAHIFTEGISNLEVFNSVFNNNPSIIDIQRGAGTITVKNSLLNKAQSQYSDMTLENNIYGQAGDFVNEFQNDFTLKPTSVAVNKGSNTLYDAIIGGNKDIASNARFLNTTIDMGCYEAKIVQTITVADITKKYTDADFTTGSASSRLTSLTYTSSNKNVAYITNDNKIHIAGVGQTTITVAQSGNETYTSATNSFILTVEKGDFTTTLDPKTYTYDGSVKYLNVTDLPAGASVSYEGNGQINAGEYLVTALINGGEYYNDSTVSNTLTITKKDLSGISFNGRMFVYDGFDKHPEVSGRLPEGVNVVYSNAQKNAGTYNNIKASISGDNYNLLELTTSMTITKTNLPDGLLLLEKEAVYDGTPKRLALEAILPEGVTIAYENNDNVNVGSYNVTVNIKGGINYNDKQLVAKITILKGNLDTDFVFASDTFTYDGTEKSIAIAGALPNQVTVNYSNNNQIGVGEYKVYAVISKPNYNDKIVEGDLIITPKSLDVTLHGQLSKTYNADPFIALESNNFVLEGVVEGDNVLLINPVVGQLNNKNVQVNKPVTVNDLRISGSDVKNYVLSSTSVSANIATVTLKEVAVSLVGKVTKTFDGSTDASLSVANFELTGVLEHDIVNLNHPSTGSYDTKGVGSNKKITVNNLTISGDDASNYILNSQTTSGQIGEITPKAIAVTADASQTKVYGASDPAFTYLVSPSLEIGDSFAGTLERTAGENVGTYAIEQGTLSAGTNYSLTYVEADFKITPKAIAVTADASQTKVYGEVEPRLSYTVTPSLVSGDSFVGTLERIAGENVGTYAIAPGTLNAGTNYTIAYTGNDFEITAKTITINAASQTKVYGEDDAALTYSFVPSLESGDLFTGTLSRVVGENIGAYAIAQGSLSAGSNYTISYVSSDYAITAKPITVTADASQTKVYGAVEPILTSTVSPSLVGNDTFTGALSRAAGDNVGSYAIEQGDLSAGSNYTITFESKDFEITAKAITVTADASQTKVYGDVEPILGYTFTPGLISGDSFAGTLERTTGEDVGTYAIEQGTLSAGANYSLTYVGADFEITPKAISVTADASQTKVYGASDPAFTYLVSPSLEIGDTFSGALERVIGENVGTYAIAQGTLTAGANYAITYTGNDFKINAKTIAVTAASQTKVYGEDDAALTYSFVPSLESGDLFTGTLSRVVGENIGAYAIAQGNLSAGSNYTISYVSSDYAITAKPITVTADASQTKVYGAVEPILTSTVSPSLVRSDTFTGALSRAIGENVGSYAIGQGDLSAGSNYVITFESKDFEITPKEITVTAEVSQTKVYGDVEPTLTYTASEVLLSGNAFSGNLSRVNGENVGTYNYTIGSLSAGSNYAVTLIGSNTFTITAKPITVTADASQTKVYGAADPAFTYSVSPSLVWTDTFTGSLLRTAGEDVGTYAITSTLKNDNYAIMYEAANFEITKADQVITWNQTLVSNCSGTTISILTASSNSGLAVSYASSNTDVVTISNDELTFINPGSATVTASQAGNSNYNAAETIALPALNSQPNLIRQQFEDVIFFDNSSKEFKSYTWYKDGILVAGQTLQYYKETGGLNGTYHAVATKLDGTVITSCPLILSSTVTVETVRVVPNPVRTNASYQLVTNVNAAKMQNARIEVFGMNGSLLDQRTTNENETTLQAPGVEGIYVVRITLANGKTFTKNLLVKN